jgi:hypothetical protein
MITLHLSAGAGIGCSQKGILRAIVQGRAKRVVPDKDAVPPTGTAGTWPSTESAPASLASPAASSGHRRIRTFSVTPSRSKPVRRPAPPSGTPSDAPRGCYRVRPPPRPLPTDSATGLIPWGSVKPTVDCPLAVVGSSGSWRRLRSRRGLLVCGQVVGVAAATAGGLAAMASRNACSLV